MITLSKTLVFSVKITALTAQLPRLLTAPKTLQEQSLRPVAVSAVTILQRGRERAVTREVDGDKMELSACSYIGFSKVINHGNSAVMLRYKRGNDTSAARRPERRLKRLPSERLYSKLRS